MVIDMESKYLLVVIAIAAIAALSIGLASAHSNSNQNIMMDNSFGMGSMMNMMGMMGGNFIHDQDDIDWMRKEMKEHMNFTDEEFDEMVEHCPMMRRK